MSKLKLTLECDGAARSAEIDVNPAGIMTSPMFDNTKITLFDQIAQVAAMESMVAEGGENLGAWQDCIKASTAFAPTMRINKRLREVFPNA